MSAVSEETHGLPQRPQVTTKDPSQQRAAQKGEYTALWVELIKLAPQLCWLLMVGVALWWFYGPIKKLIEANMISKFGVGIVQIEFVKSQIQQAASKRSEKIPESLRDRIERTTQKFVDVSILWVDDNPPNNILERKALSSLGITIDTANNSDEAIKYLKSERYDLIISDFFRAEPKTAPCFRDEIQFQPQNAGCYLMRQAKEIFASKRREPAMIFYTSFVDPEWGKPIYAFGATSQVSELLHLVLDAVERRDLTP